MKIKYFLLIMFLGLCGCSGKERELLKTLEASGKRLTLNGSATRTAFGFKVYRVRLYLAEKLKDEKAIFRDRREKKVQILMLRKVSGKKFESTVKKNIDKNFSVSEKKKYSAELSQFLDCFSDRTLPNGSVVNIDFVPSKGTLIYVGGKRVAVISGDDFYHMLLRLWIGAPLQKSIKRGLLGDL
jgi:hypothetical protein